MIDESLLKEWNYEKTKTLPSSIRLKVVKRFGGDVAKGMNGKHLFQIVLQVMDVHTVQIKKCL